MLTVACVLVKGHVDFTPEYVHRLHAMSRRWIARPFRFVCLTDQPEAMGDGIEAIRIALPHDERGEPLKGWWAKIALFSPLHDLGERVLYLDLDTLIVDAVDEIVDYPADFALVPDGAPHFKPKGGLAVVKAFNSSVMVWTRGDAETLWPLWHDWSPAVAKVFHGDQDWIGHKMPDAAKMPLSWFPRISQVRPPWPAEAKVVLVKKPKNVEAARQWPWFAKAWG